MGRAGFPEGANVNNYGTASASSSNCLKENRYQILVVMTSINYNRNSHKLSGTVVENRSRLLSGIENRI